MSLIMDRALPAQNFCPQNFRPLGTRSQKVRLIFLLCYGGFTSGHFLAHDFRTLAYLYVVMRNPK